MNGRLKLLWCIFASTGSFGLCVMPAGWVCWSLHKGENSRTILLNAVIWVHLIFLVTLVTSNYEYVQCWVCLWIYGTFSQLAMPSVRPHYFMICMCMCVSTLTCLKMSRTDYTVVSFVKFRPKIVKPFFSFLNI